jgi:predicted phage terminase large subunit-like protein
MNDFSESIAQPTQPVPDPLRTPDLVSALLRNSFPAFIRKTFMTLNPGVAFCDNWHINAIAHHLELVRLGTIKRLIITMPPRSLKSISASIAFPAFIHGHDPSREIICVSYGQELATKLHNDYRTILCSDWFRFIFPLTRIGVWKDAESEVKLTGSGSRVATSIGGALTGRGADIVIIDDPLKPSDAPSQAKRAAVNEWFKSTLLSRLDDWTVLNLSAIAPADAAIDIGGGRVYPRKADEVLHEAREPRHILDEILRTMGASAFAAQYLQCPVPAEGTTFRRRWFQYYTELPSKQPNDYTFQSWDTASKNGAKNDYSVCTTWRIAKGDYYLLDVIRAKHEFPELKAKAIDAWRAWRPNGVLIEDAGVGAGLIPELKRAGISAIGIIADQSKELRASFQTIKFESKRVWFPKAAPWLPALETELLEFPGGRHDDQVDSVVQMLGYQVPAGVTFRWVKF